MRALPTCYLFDFLDLFDLSDAGGGWRLAAGGCWRGKGRAQMRVLPTCYLLIRTEKGETVGVKPNRGEVVVLILGELTLSNFFWELEDETHPPLAFMSQNHFSNKPNSLSIQSKPKIMLPPHLLCQGPVSFTVQADNAAGHGDELPRHSSKSPLQRSFSSDCLDELRSRPGVLRRSSDPPVSPRRGGKRPSHSRRSSRKAVTDRWQSTSVAATPKGDSAPSLPVQRKADVAPRLPRHDNASRPIRRSSICKSQNLCRQADDRRSPLSAINA
jgi:hypothetical protein